MASGIVIGEAAPFILFDDVRAGGAGLLFRHGFKIIEARRPDEVKPALRLVREATAQGLHAAGFLAYEAGHALEAKLAPLSTSAAAFDPPLLWFGLFEDVEQVGYVPSLLPDPDSGWAGPAAPRVERSAYEASLARVKEHIAAGNIYQANLAFRAEVLTAGHPLAVYAGVRRRAKAGHGAVVFTGEHWLLSFSPELFFTLEKGQVTAQPMKGTASRHPDPEQDVEEARALRADPKQRAENLMIVDLLRNDLSRVSRPGTVKVPSLFAVESYPTVHQMTSTVTSELEDGLDAVDIVEAIFPCGSITGAPKIRAMEIIAEEEGGPRGVYTGSIGRIAPGGDASFNVAIRTLTIRAGEARALMGLGSGIVADSRAEEEWRECLAKGAFVSDPDRSFDLIETMRFDPRDGIADVDRHLARMKRSAEAFGFPFDRHGARNEIQAATFHLREARKVRLLLSRSGAVAIEVRPCASAPSRAVNVALAPLPVPSEDFRLRHKTSDRAFYDEARERAGTFELVFEDQAGFLTEGSFTNIFVPQGGKLRTPPVWRGLLPGVLRERLIASGEAEEADLVAADLVNGFYIGNAARGLIPAVLR
jgi:para-aminobenzoate synthetase/4-amino-4-deoxychorismate lyase